MKELKKLLGKVMHGATKMPKGGKKKNERARKRDMEERL